MPKLTLPASTVARLPAGELFQVVALTPDELAVVKTAHEAHVASVDAFNSLALDAQEAELANGRRALRKEAPVKASAVAEVARRRAQLVHMEAALDLDEALSELGERYAVIDPRNRIDRTTGQIKR